MIFISAGWLPNPFLLVTTDSCQACETPRKELAADAAERLGTGSSSSSSRRRPAALQPDHRDRSSPARRQPDRDSGCGRVGTTSSCRRRLVGPAAPRPSGKTMYTHIPLREDRLKSLCRKTMLFQVKFRCAAILHNRHHCKRWLGIGLFFFHRVVYSVWKNW